MMALRPGSRLFEWACLRLGADSDVVAALRDSLRSAFEPGRFLYYDSFHGAPLGHLEFEANVLLALVVRRRLDDMARRLV